MVDGRVSAAARLANSTLPAMVQEEVNQQQCQQPAADSGCGVCAASGPSPRRKDRFSFFHETVLPSGGGGIAVRPESLREWNNISVL